jgi:hypothetical protein
VSGDLVGTGWGDTVVRVELLDEGSPTSMSILARREGSYFRLPYTIPETVLWAFPPGSLVGCEVVDGSLRVTELGPLQPTKVVGAITAGAVEEALRAAVNGWVEEVTYFMRARPAPTGQHFDTPDFGVQLLGWDGPVSLACGASDVLPDGRLDAGILMFKGYMAPIVDTAAGRHVELDATEHWRTRGITKVADVTFRWTEAVGSEGPEQSLASVTLLDRSGASATIGLANTDGLRFRPRVDRVILSFD